MKFTKFLWLFLSIILASTVLLTACGDISKKDSESTELISKDQEISGEDGGISWSLKNGVLTFSGKGKMTDYKYDSKPWKAYIVSIKKVVIEDGIESIGNDAFSYCVNLKDVSIPDSVTSIGKMAFENCESLGSITIPDSVTTIGESAFCFCLSLKDITIPDSVTSIAKFAFSGCDILKDIYFNGPIPRWNAFGFNECKIPDSITVHCTDGDI